MEAVYWKGVDAYLSRDGILVSLGFPPIKSTGEARPATGGGDGRLMRETSDDDDGGWGVGPPWH